ncbi:hypothetical protein ElyMa_000481100 [Elysia marginata]|uniref:G-protein coupled receptors family 1 profile domain-containing protein n=1 Tax=Elysia marginata TaxID=1093978 RepID=A0AAV4FVR4_9GAST|nr:hypothetical protein ElyMa_000481100 [Elysia marginata]
MPRPSTKVGPSGVQLVLATLFWILAFFMSVGLAAASLLTECWFRWEEATTKSNHCYGLFVSATQSDEKPCELKAVVRETGEELFRDFDLHSMIALMFLSIGFDVFALTAGMLYFFGKGKARTSLWKRSIPTVASGLIAAGMAFLACLIFIVDLEEVSDTKIEAYVDDRCTTNLDNVNLMPRTGFSVYIALTAGAIDLIKSAIFGALVSCF